MLFNRTSILTLFTAGCGWSPLYSPPAPPQELHYDHVLVEPEMKPEFVAFLADCERFPTAKEKCKKRLPDLFSVALGTERHNEKLTSNTIGLCYYSSKRAVIIKESIWKTGTCRSRWIMYHELGHCLLDSGHAPNTNSHKIMNTYIMSEKFCNENWPTLVNDLFTTHYPK